MHESVHSINKCYALQEKITALYTCDTALVPEEFFRVLEEMTVFSYKLENMLIAQRQQMIEKHLLQEEGK